jgi:hypothetical protein
VRGKGEERRAEERRDLKLAVKTIRSCPGPSREEV